MSLIFDEELNLLAYKEFSSSIYNWDGIQLIDGKLLVPNTNKSNLNRNENEIKFYVYEIQNQ